LQPMQTVSNLCKAVRRKLVIKAAPASQAQSRA
jgi:hypothetical protein